MLTHEGEFNKAHGEVGQLIETVRLARKVGRRMGEVERTIFAELLKVGFQLITAFVGSAGDGNVAEKNRQMAEFVRSLRKDQPPPPAKREGEPAVFTADSKGVPMRPPGCEKPGSGQRRMKGEKASRNRCHTWERCTRSTVSCERATTS
jgi:hypothetical protein